MPRPKKVQPEAAEKTATRSTRRKRDRVEENEETSQSIAPKRRGTRAKAEGRSTKGAVNGHPSDYDFPSDEDGEVGKAQEDEAVTGTPGKIKTVADAVVASDANGEVSTPGNRKSKDKNVETPLKTTPSRARGTPVGETPRWRRNDRSARKKSARALIERVVAGDGSDEDEDLAREIYESSQEEVEDSEAEEEQERDEGQEEQAEATTPSKRPRGRPKGSVSKRKKSPTPPRDLPPHELYFAENRPGMAKTSNNTLASLKLLTHDEYFSILHDYKNPHAEDIEFLQSIHVQSFPQWAFELSQGFSVCLYGYGSKRALLNKFAQHLYDATPDHIGHKIVIANGYVRTANNNHAQLLREILSTVASAVDRGHKLPGGAGNPTAMLDSLRALLAAHPGTQVTLVLNSIDAAPLRRVAGAQPVLAQLAAHPRVRLVCSADTPDFALLWDAALRASFAFAFHDCTTFAPFGPAEADVVDDVHELLGRRARRVGGKEGVAYVLRSLPENAKNLFRLLVGEVLVAAADGGDDDGGGVGGGDNPGIEYRMLYNKAVEEFICSSEMAFRTLLKEFHDHQIITSRKDVLGTELLSVPFSKEELESILEELMS
ncbi:Origin recognition complex subunit 2 [Diatrype stigma]|uniref:Origin recognition complex subunit 2 n=1 Tax=Diatrype stigma TaxID=117547 RepID=A0AAN9UBN2_9PEZI